MSWGCAMRFLRKAAGRIRLVPAILVLAGAVAAAPPAFPGRLSILNGLVARVDGTEIRVHSRDYDVSQAAIKDPSGRILAADAIGPGTKVSLFFDSGRLKAVVVYPSLPE